MKSEHGMKQKMKAEKSFVVAVIHFVANVSASNKKPTDIEQNCLAPNQKDFKQVQGGKFFYS